MKENGFTLLELLVALTIAGLLVTVGVPNLRAMIMDNRIISDANHFVATVNAARSSAVRYQRPAIVCSTANFDAAVPSCSGSTDWSDGWFVWVDKDFDAVTTADEVVVVAPPLNGSVSMTSGAANRFSYDARGFGTSTGDAISFCDGRSGETGRVIRINDAGRVNISRQGCS
ncbi:MAG: GspH/FimT family pseudopilin [Proteobacteria bacterium]|nr:GspH/FimT family pseudopilin [Pseudomonadota bacterium]